MADGFGETYFDIDTDLKEIFNSFNISVWVDQRFSLYSCSARQMWHMLGSPYRGSWYHAYLGLIRLFGYYITLNFILRLILEIVITKHYFIDHLVFN